MIVKILNMNEGKIEKMKMIRWELKVEIMVERMWWKIERKKVDIKWEGREEKNIERKMVEKNGKRKWDLRMLIKLLNIVGEWVIIGRNEFLKDLRVNIVDFDEKVLENKGREKEIENVFRLNWNVMGIN